MKIRTIALVVLVASQHTSANPLYNYYGGGGYGAFGNGFGNYYNNFYLGTGYGMGGYGDPLNADFNLSVCTARSVDISQCTPTDPDRELFEWRFVQYSGWRKFPRYSAARKDWWDFKKTLHWPFNRVAPPIY